VVGEGGGWDGEGGVLVVFGWGLGFRLRVWKYFIEICIERA
jgi:hypothetical protein